MTTPKWHWTKQQDAKEIKERMIKSKLGVHSSVSTEFKKGRTNQFKGIELPKYMADAAAEGRRNSGMYENKKKHNGDFGKGHTPWNKGIPVSEETKAKMRAKLKGRKVWNTGNGIGTPLGHSIRRCDKYVEWRTSVFTRDNYTCVICKEVGKKLHADHIKAFALICKEQKITNLKDALFCQELWDIKNGRTLCYSCHRKTENYAGKYQTNLHKFPRAIVKLKNK